MSTRTVLIRNVFSNWTGLLLSILIGFFLSPYMVHSLGDSMYGLWVLILSVTGYMGLLDSGLKTSIVRFVAQFNATSDKEALNDIATTSLVLYSMLSLVVVFITLGLAFWFDRIFKVSPDELQVVRLVVCLGGAGLVLGLPMGVFGGLVVGLQRYDLMSNANIAGMVVRTIGIVVLLSSGFGVVAVSSMQVASQVLVGGLLVWYAYREYPALAFRWSSFRKETVKLLYGYSGFMLLNNFAMYFLFYSGELVVGMFLDIASVTYYAIATSLVHYLSQFVGAMTQVFHPYASEQHAKGNTDIVKATVLLGTKWCLLIVLPVALAYIVFGKIFIKLWMGPSYAEGAGPLLLVSAVGRIAWLSHSSAGNILLGIGKHKVITAVNAATGIVGLVLGVLLVKKIGLIGVAIGLSSALIFSQLFMVWYVMAVFNISLSEYLRKAYAGPFVASLPFAGTLILLEFLLPPDRLVVFFAEVAAGVAVFTVCSYYAAFTPQEREEYFHPHLQRLRWILPAVR